MERASDILRVAIVAPTFNHGRTLLGVLNAVEACHPDLTLICINDGATDDTSNALANWSDDDRRVVVTHPANRGKAAALRSGFSEAVARGHTHAVTIDTDAQHDPADIAALIEAAGRCPTALVLGERADHIVGCPRRSLWGRWSSNLLVRLESGLRVRDSQCGLRVYPLDLTHRLGGRAGRYGFETAILTRFAWAGLPVVRVPVGCIYDVPGGRISHFRPAYDSFAALLMHVWLLHRALLPAGRWGDEPTGTIWHRVGRWLNPVPAWRAMREHPQHRQRFAAAFGVGTFIALLPLYGVKTYVCLAVARWCRLEPLPLVGASSAVSAPPIGPMLAGCAIACGSVLLHGRAPTWGRYDVWQRGMLAVLRDVALEWTVGGLLLGAVLGLTVYVMTKWLLERRASEPAPDAAPAA